MKQSLLYGLAAVAVVITSPAALAQGNTRVFKWDGEIPIPDDTPNNFFAFAEIVVPDDPNGNIIKHLDVDLIIEHTYQGDLMIELQHVENDIRIRLMDRPGYPEDNQFGWSSDNLGNPAPLAAAQDMQHTLRFSPNAHATTPSRGSTSSPCERLASRSRLRW